MNCFVFIEWREEEVAKINATKQGAGKEIFPREKERIVHYLFFHSSKSGFSSIS
jgi:hypothetical protein